jgi:hypothetical protein
MFQDDGTNVIHTEQSWCPSESATDGGNSEHVRAIILNSRRVNIDRYANDQVRQEAMHMRFAPS